MSIWYRIIAVVYMVIGIVSLLTGDETGNGTLFIIGGLLIGQIEDVAGRDKS